MEKVKALLEKEKQNTETYLKYIINHVPYYIFWKNKDSVFLGCNEKFAQSAGLKSAEEIVGKTDYDMPWELEESAAYIADDQMVMQNKKSKLDIEENQTINGKQITLLTSKVPLFDENGEVCGVLGIYSDITERKRAEQELHIAKTKAEQAAKAKINFLGMVSHELRTPLNGILGSLQVLNRKINDPKIKEHLNDIDQSATHLLNLVNDILDFSCMEQGVFTIRETLFDLNSLVKSSILDVKNKLKNRKNRIVYECDTDIPKFVLGDAFRIRQVLLNLIGNAAKFTSGGTIKVSVFCINSTSENISLRISVEDNGIGISEDMKDKIFERFVQENADPSRSYEGVGLGLSISQQIIEAMGSKIEVQSRSGQGSTFWFDITLKKPYENTSSNGQEKEDFLDQQYEATVLLVEDNLLNQKIARILLEDFGCEVDLAINGKIALEKVASKRYDLILMDIGLPGMDGIEVTEEIRKDSRNQDLPIIALTAHAMEHDIESFYKASINDVLIKPFNVVNLKKIFNRWLLSK